MTDINVCFSADNNYGIYAGVAIASVLNNASDDDNLHIYILDSGIGGENKEKIFSLKSIHNCEIRFIQIDERIFEPYKKVNTHRYITLATFYRLKLASILPDIPRCVYLDCDVIVNSSLKYLFEFDFNDNLIAAVTDISNASSKKHDLTYFNAGMIVMDLDKIRKSKTEDAFLEYVAENREKITLGDQQIINEVLKGRVKILPEDWNVQTSNFVNRSSYTSHPKIIHYVGQQKPWILGNWNYFKKYYYENLQLTPWALKDYKNQYIKSEFISLLRYFCYRPFFALRPRFWNALYHTYIVKD